MLDFLFGFGARLSRLYYFLSTIALGMVMAAIVFAVVMVAHPQAPGRTLMSLMTWPVIVVGIFFMWVTFNLQSMRVRDIGWDPVCIMPAWIAAVIIDGVVAGRVPAWALEGHHGTMVGALINLALVLALTFWPSSDQDEGASMSRPSASRGASKSTVSAERLAMAKKTEQWRY